MQLQPRRSFLLTLHYLSLDVVAGATISSWAFWRLPDGHQSADTASLLLLGCVTWAIYIIDRLLDLQLPQPPATPRHNFHKQHRHVLLLLFYGLLLTTGIGLFWLPRPVLWYGVAVAVAIGLYFLLLKRWQGQRFQWVKEPITALFYTLAVVGVPYAYKPAITTSMWLLGGMFFLVVYQSLLTYAYFEQQANQGEASGYGRAIRLIMITIIVLSLLFFGDSLGYKQLLAYTLLLMAIVNGLMAARSDYFLPNERYRLFGEIVFLFPLGVLLWSFFG